MSGGGLEVGWSDGVTGPCFYYHPTGYLSQDHLYDGSCRVPKISKMVSPNAQVLFKYLHMSRMLKSHWPNQVAWLTRTHRVEKSPLFDGSMCKIILPGHK